MRQPSEAEQKQAFISYASADHARVLPVVTELEKAGVPIWVDRREIRSNYGEEIVRAIRDCKILVLMCSDASVRSRNVKAEILLAWKFGKPYLPLLLEQVSYPDQILYWLEGWQWVEVLHRPAAEWLPPALRALNYAGVRCDESLLAVGGADSCVEPTPTECTLRGLRAVAKLTDQLWPVQADLFGRGRSVTQVRGLGAPQDGLQRGYALGSRVCLILESDRQGHLLLLDEGPEGITYSLCPSWFAPDTLVRPGRNCLPQRDSRYAAFTVTGKAGREHLLAVITDEPMGLDWMPLRPETPARALCQADVQIVLAKLRAIDGHRWTALSTYFDVLA